MKTIFIFLFLAGVFSHYAISQVHSNITFDAGTGIIVQTGADICADSVIFHGSYTITGTVCGNPVGFETIYSEIPKEYFLYENFPNPFNPSTSITFDLPKLEYVKLSVYDLLGREVEVILSEKLNAGKYRVDWNGSSYPSGVYFYKLVSDEFTNVKKMVLLK